MFTGSRKIYPINNIDGLNVSPSKKWIAQSNKYRTNDIICINKTKIVAWDERKKT